MAKLQDIKTPLLQFEEGAAPATPASGVVEIYAKTDGLLYSKDDAGTETALGGGSESPLTTKGDVYVYGSADARLPVGTNGQVLTADSTQTLGVKWATASGGGGWNDVILTPPSSPSSYNDEFDDESLDANWTKVDVPSYAQTYTEQNGVMSVLCHDRGVVCAALLKSFTGLTPPVTIETAFRLMANDANFPSAGLIFSEGETYGSGSKKQITAMHGYTATGIQNLLLGEWTDFATRNSLSEKACGSGPKPFYYIRLIWVSTNTFRVQISPDGVTWMQPLADFSKTCAPDHFGLAMTGSDNNGDDFISTFEYFRVY